MADYRQYQHDLLETAGQASYREFPLGEKTARAFLACPRHLFIKRTRLFGQWVNIDPAHSDEYLEFLYRDVPLALMEDREGNILSTISQPSFVLYMLDLLQPKEGHAVFELGTGSGWNAALLSSMVGEKGHVYSAEIIPEVARTAQENIRKLQINNVTVIEGDFDTGLPKEILFDRVIFTAGGSDLPHFLFNQVVSNGIILFPFKVKGGGDILYLLQKQRDHFESAYTIDCAFVPVTGKYHRVNTDPVLMQQIPEWERVKNQMISQSPLWEWGVPTSGGFANKSHPFRFFLSISEPDYFALQKDENDDVISAFGLWDRESLAICKDDKLFAYGNDRAKERFLNRLRQCAAMGMPGSAEYRLAVYPVAAEITAKDNQWLQKRNEAQFLWTVAGK